MGGTRKGGLAAAKTNKVLYGPDFYRRIGAIGGSNGSTGGFGSGEQGRKLASIAGRKGGLISRKGRV